MSLKDNINMVKDELNSEEKFFEKAVITERFIKKYKNVMIGSVVAVVIVVAANIIFESNKETQISAANAALTELMNDSTNADALASLKESSKSLYDAWSFSKAIADKNVALLKELESSKTVIINDLAGYESAQASNSSSDLEAYALKQDAIYRDLALVQSAIILLKNGSVDQAHQKLLLINVQSPLGKIAQVLLHYGVK